MLSSIYITPLLSLHLVIHFIHLPSLDIIQFFIRAFVCSFLFFLVCCFIIFHHIPDYSIFCFVNAVGYSFSSLVESLINFQCCCYLFYIFCETLYLTPSLVIMPASLDSTHLCHFLWLFCFCRHLIFLSMLLFIYCASKNFYFFVSNFAYVFCLLCSSLQIFCQCFSLFIYFLC